MKLLIIALALFGAVSASAACKEGSRDTVILNNAVGDHPISENRVCHNGTYMTAAEQAAYVHNPKVGCTEGAQGSVTLYDAVGDHNITEVRFCHNGTYMTAAEQAAYVHNPKTTCKEGARYIDNDYYNEANSEHPTQVEKVCHNNKWIDAN